MNDMSIIRALVLGGVVLTGTMLSAQAPDGGLPRALGVALVLRAARHESGLGELLTSDL